MPQPLEVMTEDQLLDHATRCATTARQAELDLLRTAYHWAVLNSPDRLDPHQTGKPGREKAKRYGGAGTQPVSEFAAATLGARIGFSPYAAARLIGDAQDLAHRHPELWSRVQAFEVRASYARHVTQKTRDLTEDEAGYVDHAVAEAADGRICWTRFEDLVDAAAAAAAPEVARAKEDAARKARFAKKLRGTDPDTRHGMASFLIRADIATITQIDAVITAVAAALKTALPDLSMDERRLRALMLLLAQQVPVDSPARDAQPDVVDQQTDVPTWAADDQPTDTTEPGSEPHPEDVAAAGADLAGIDLTALLPTVQLYVHLYGGTVSTEGPEFERDPETGLQRDQIARIEGHGPVTTTWLRTVLGRTCRFKITPVMDLAGQAPVDAYEIPDRHRAAVHLMTPADVFPYASNLGRRKQIDHTVPYDPEGPPGQSGIGNYGPMTVGHHRIKTHGHWQVKQPFPGIYLWRDPGGRFHLVDHTGTRPLPGTTTKPITVELYRTPVRVDVDLAA